MAPRTIYLVPTQSVPTNKSVMSNNRSAQRAVISLNRPSIASTSAPTMKASTHPLKRSAVDSVEELLSEHTGVSGPRKRERLNHLTQEEKMNRRKLKNRVAAQTARDRKKVRSQKLEDVVRELLAENQRLREENRRLREEQKQTKDLPFESAAFINAPLPRDQGKSRLSLILLFLSTLFPKMSLLESSKILRKTLTSISCPASYPQKKSLNKPTTQRNLVHRMKPRRLRSKIS